MARFKDYLVVFLNCVCFSLLLLCNYKIADANCLALSLSSLEYKRSSVYFSM